MDPKERHKFVDPILEARICRGSPPLASTRQIVPSDPDTLGLAPSPPASPRRGPSGVAFVDLKPPPFSPRVVRVHGSAVTAASR